MKVLSKPLTQDFKLACDPEGDAIVSFRQATFGDTKAIADLTAKRVQRMAAEEGTIEMEQQFNIYEEWALQLYRTCTGIRGIVDEADKELFDFTEGGPGTPARPKSQAGFFNALYRLADNVVTEMREHMLKVNPQWAVGGAEGE